MQIQQNKTQLKNILANPYKKEIDNGKLNEEQVQRLMEGFKQTTFHENLLARPSPTIKGKYELVYGHHRLEACRRLYGNNHTINLNTANYSDEQMLIDLCRENLTQGNNADFRHEFDSVILVKKYLSSDATRSTQTKPHTRKDQEIGSISIARLLSKEGKTISHTKVNSLLLMQKNLAPEIINKIVKKNAGMQDDNFIGIKEAETLAKIESPDEQREALKVVQQLRKQESGRTCDLLQTYVNASEEEKKKLAEGTLTIDEARRNREPDSLSPLQMSLRINKRSLELINEMRTLRKTLYQFRKEKLFDQFNPQQKRNFHEKLTTLKTEYADLVGELEQSLEVLK